MARGDSWAEVSFGTKLKGNFYKFCIFRSNDIEKATAAKFKVEQKQREEAKTRKDENSMFANQVKKTLSIFPKFL
jgi:hypothetical protein